MSGSFGFSLFAAIKNFIQSLNLSCAFLTFPFVLYFFAWFPSNIGGIKVNKSVDTEQELQKDLSSESVKLSDNIASENLATVFEKQGKKGKAIRIYEKLILKYPEKRTYFAGRIEELKRN